MTIARYLSKFANLLNSDGKVVNAGIANNTLQSDKFASGTLGNFRNRIINGDMKISQRGASFTNIVGAYCIDRWVCSNVNTAVVNITQNSDVPTGSGLSYSLRATIGTADTSIAAGEYSLIVQHIEGYNVVDLVGVPITLSFWVRSSKTGIHSVKLRNSSADRNYVSEYTINTANTWEKKSITISGGLISNGTWDFTNGIGLSVQWTLAVGATFQTSTTNAWLNTNYLGSTNQVNCLDTVGNIFAITGVQLEKGSVASEFEFRPISTEYALCQRYYEAGIVRSQTYGPAGNTLNTCYYKVVKRVIPTLTNTFTGSNTTTYYQQQPNVYGFEFGSLIANTGFANCSGGWTASAEL